MYSALRHRAGVRKSTLSCQTASIWSSPVDTSRCNDCTESITEPMIRAGSIGDLDLGCINGMRAAPFKLPPERVTDATARGALN